MNKSTDDSHHVAGDCKLLNATLAQARIATDMLVRDAEARQAERVYLNNQMAQERRRKRAFPAFLMIVAVTILIVSL